MQYCYKDLLSIMFSLPVVPLHSCEYRASPFLGHSSHRGPQPLGVSSSIQQQEDLEICMARALEQRPCRYSRQQFPRLVSITSTTLCQLKQEFGQIKKTTAHIYLPYIYLLYMYLLFEVISLQYCTYIITICTCMITVHN